MRRWNRLWDIVLGVIVSLLCAFPVSAREKVILDSDMVEGFDDGVAMLALAQSPGIELIGVTIVAGNTWGFRRRGLCVAPARNRGPEHPRGRGRGSSVQAAAVRIVRAGAAAVRHGA